MNDFAMADGTRIVARLEQALSSRTSREGDQFTLTVISPAQYAGAKIDGSVIRVNDLQRSGTSANLVLDLDAIQLRNSGRASSFDGILESARTPDGQTIRIDSENAVRDPNTSNQAIQRGAIGAAVGAIIGALAGGGKGAAIGAAIGGAGGAGTVLIEGRDRLDLPIGTELTIVARR
jgi:outer membrane lipoprotein SlyB